MKKVLSLLLVAVMILGCMMSLTSCGQKSGGALTLNVGARPDTIDPALNSAVDGATYIVHTFTGLVGYEPDDEGKPQLVAQLAKELPKGVALEDGKTSYTFELRDDLKWSDGSKLDANDFVYSWNRAADPMTGADYAYMFEVIDGYADVADMYVTSEDAEGNVVFEKDADGNPKYKDGKKALNVTASEDGKSLTVVLTVDVPYFHELCAFPAYLPVKKDVVGVFLLMNLFYGFRKSGKYKPRSVFLVFIIASQLPCQGYAVAVIKLCIFQKPFRYGNGQ